jgi:chromosomal replication initiation ATPase DnaA
MQQENKEIEALLKNIQLGLQKYSVKELNKALQSVLSKSGSQNNEIQFVLKIVSQKYKISTKTLTTSRARGDIQEARMLAYCLLHYTLGLSIRSIAKDVFNRWHNSVASALKQYKNLDPERFKIDREFEKKLKECQGQLLNFINPIK